MKILQVTNFFKPSWETGGVTKVAYEISKKLAEMGHDITVYTTDGFESRLDVEKNKLVKVDGMRTYYFRNLSRLLTIRMKLPIPYYLLLIAKKEVKNFDIIHIHEYRTLLAVIIHYYVKKHRIPYVLQAHGSVPRIIENKGLKYLFDIFFGYKILRDASKVIAVSNVEVDQYIKMGVPKEKIVVVPNGIDVNSFIDLPEKGTFGKQYGISEKYIVLFLGRLNEIKGIEFLIESFAELRKEMNDVILVLAGYDDGYKAKAEILINKFNLTEQVYFTGFIDGIDKFAAYVDADVLVYPSIFEIFGLVPFEAILSGTPVIVTDDCGCGELVRDAKCGCMVKYGDIEGLKNTMMSLIRNPDASANLVNNGKMYITNNLSYDKAVKSLEGIYEDCIHNI